MPTKKAIIDELLHDGVSVKDIHKLTGFKIRTVYKSLWLKRTQEAFLEKEKFDQPLKHKGFWSSNEFDYGRYGVNPEYKMDKLSVPEFKLIYHVDHCRLKKLY